MTSTIRITSTLLFYALFFAEPALCQVVRRRRSSVGRIVAGVVVGVLALIALCLLMTFLMRRRRARMTGVTTTTTGGYTGTGAKPLFGGGNIGWSPFGKHNHNNGAVGGQGYGAGNQQYSSPYGQQQGNQGINGQYNHSQGQYPPPNAPPPAYAQGKAEAGYAPPPGPPPAHTVGGKDNHFIGGFRG